MLFIYTLQNAQRKDPSYSPKEALDILGNLKYVADPNGGVTHTKEEPNGAYVVNLDTTRKYPYKVMSVALDMKTNIADSATYDMDRNGVPKIKTSFKIDIDTLTPSNAVSADVNSEDSKDLNRILKILKDSTPTAMRFPPRPC